MFTMVAVIKKFHGRRVPSPRMKNMIQTAWYLVKVTRIHCYSIAYTQYDTIEYCIH